MEELYTLPEIAFVAGEKQTIAMRLLTPKPGSYPFDASGGAVNFSVISYSTKNGVPALSKPCLLREDESGVICVAVAELEPQDTVGLYGKYVYQATIIDRDKESEIPGQGIMLIAKNINRGFVEANT
jgi:hypothetical protein